MTFALLTLLALAPSVPERMAWKIDGVTREALVYSPSKKSDNGPPLVFAFHGHGGRMQGAARMFGFHDLWPEAVVVYPQGLRSAKVSPGAGTVSGTVTEIWHDSVT